VLRRGIWGSNLQIWELPLTATKVVYGAGCRFRRLDRDDTALQWKPSGPRLRLEDRGAGRRHAGASPGTASLGCAEVGYVRSAAPVDHRPAATRWFRDPDVVACSMPLGLMFGRPGPPFSRAIWCRDFERVPVAHGASDCVDPGLVQSAGASAPWRWMRACPPTR